MIKIAICDNRNDFIDRIKNILSDYMRTSGMLYEIDTFNSGKDLVRLGIEMIRYKIIFLNVNRYEADGFAAARMIRKISKEIFIILISDDTGYSLEGYKVNAVRYILKYDNRLAQTVSECMDAVNDMMNYRIAFKEFNFSEGRLKVALERILYIESRMHKLEFNIMEEKLTKYTLYESLNQVEQKLAGNDFIRIHQSFLVNLRRISSIIRYEVVLDNNICLYIPRSRYKEVKDKYLNFLDEYD